MSAMKSQSNQCSSTAAIATSVSNKLDPLLSLMSLPKPSILSSVLELSNYTREKLDRESHTRLSAVRNAQSQSEASIMDIKDSVSSKGEH